MAVDLKVDIIYFKTPTDFEMEFNLSVCCTMRMLTSKCDGAKEFLTDLSKGVSRSRVIICVGDINKQDGMLNIASTAVGLELCSYDADAYCVAHQNSRNVLLPEGALPLVTEDGMLGGCLIESGPQIIIFLTDEKELRKKILKELVFEYLTALSGGNTVSTDDAVNNLEDADSGQVDEAKFADDSATDADDNDTADNNDENAGEDIDEETLVLTEEEQNTDKPDANPDGTNDFDDTVLNSKDANNFIDISPDDITFKTVKPKSKFLGLKITIGILCSVLTLIVAALLYYYFF